MLLGCELCSQLGFEEELTHLERFVLQGTRELLMRVGQRSDVGGLEFMKDPLPPRGTVCLTGCEGYRLGPGQRLLRRLGKQSRWPGPGWWRWKWGEVQIWLGGILANSLHVLCGVNHFTSLFGFVQGNDNSGTCSVECYVD